MRYSDEIRPTYTIKGYGFTGVYRIIKFKQSDGIFINFKEPEEKEENSQKLDNNISRAKSTVLQIALCNEWQLFATLTLNPQKYDRSDLKKFHKDLKEFIKYQGRKHNTKITYVLVPEHHKDGSWHMHGLFNGIPETELTSFIKGVHPQKLIKAGFKNWNAYSQKFGFVSVDNIRDHVATAFYLVKYISKDLSARTDELNAHLFYNSLNLKRADNIGEVYGSCSDLDKLLTYHGDFCSTGMVKNENWFFPLKYDNGTHIEEMGGNLNNEMVINNALPNHLLSLENTSRIRENDTQKVKLSAFQFLKPEDLIKLY